MSKFKYLNLYLIKVKPIIQIIKIQLCKFLMFVKIRNTAIMGKVYSQSKDMVR